MSDPVNEAERSLGQLVASATAEMSALVHDEIALAKAEVKQDVKRGAIGSAAGIAAATVLLFSLPMLSFALAYGIQAWSHWHISVCFLLSFAANVILAGLLGLLAYAKFKKVKPPEKSLSSAKRTAAVLQNAKPHPRPERAALTAAARDEAAAVGRSSA
ncbi:phage holin family protein [Streptomyces sp. NBC_01216]|uniref:phage holin family protein n=1 Tax=unclassified Streptomyces TaxID=2593676 RepID=UPI002E110F4B|nr:phage holin family protein [Streptomyces sp. NBC_01216]